MQQIFKVEKDEEGGTHYEPILVSNAFHQKLMSAIYAGPIAQQVFDQMQADMDKIAQGDLFEGSMPTMGIQLVPTDEERCAEWRKNYFKDMTGAVGFEKFEDFFTFEKGYASEDPHDSFLLPPSKAAFDAYLSF